MERKEGLPFVAAHTYMAYIREYPAGGEGPAKQTSITRCLFQVSRNWIQDSLVTTWESL